MDTRETLERAADFLENRGQRDLGDDLRKKADRIEVLEAENARLRALGFEMAEVIKASGPGAPLPAQEAAAEFFGQVDNMDRTALEGKDTTNDQ